MVLQMGAGAERPTGPLVGYQRWRRLLFVHWPLPAAALRPLVPASLAIDQFAGSAYVGLVAFVVQAARPVGVPAWLGLRFLETNVRTYVRVGGGWPGVYFFSLDAASLLAVVGARLSLGLPYCWASGREQVGPDAVDYQLRRRALQPAACHLRYTLGPPLSSARPGTLEHFLIERYVLHVPRGPSLWSVAIRHRPYPLWQVGSVELDDELVPAAGLGRLGPPPLAHFSSGVDVRIFAPRVVVAPRVQRRRT